MTPQLLPCPACERVTTLRAEVRPTARLRCPHCGYEALYQQLASIPEPTWQVVGEGAESVGTDEADPLWLAGRQTIDATAAPPGSQTINMIDPSAQTIVDLFGKYDGLSSTEPSEQVSTVSATGDLERTAAHESTTSAQNGGPPKFQTTTQARFERHHRKKRPSPLWSVVQIALGGLAAIPIGLLLVWHVVGVDVGDAAPWVAQYVPWIVPQELRPYQPPANFGLPSQPRRSSLPTIGGEPFPSSEVPASDQVATGEPLASEDTGATGNTFAAEPVGTSEPLTDAGEETSTEPASSERATPESENVFALIRQATTHVEEWSVAAQQKDTGLRALTEATYRDLTDLALALEELPSENPVWRTVRRQLQPLGLLVVDDAQVRQLISQGSRYWVSKPTARSSEEGLSSGKQIYGLAAIVTVDSAEQVNDAERAWWDVAVNEASQLGDPPLQICIPLDVARELAQGRPVPEQQLFLVGTVSQETSKKSGEEAAPTAARFVASYVIELAK